jgi:hypothetical protein
MLGANALMHPSFHGPLLLAGGTDGPEGSVLVLISEAIFVVSVALIYRRRRYPLLSDVEPADRSVQVELGARPIDSPSPVA